MCSYKEDYCARVIPASCRWRLFVCVTVLLAVFHSPSVARLIFTGPNPFFSSASFPQDGLLFQGSGSFALVDRNPRGWFGNLDDPAALPSANYTMTSQNLRLTNPVSQFSLLGTWTQNKASLVPYYFESHGFRIQTFLSAGLEDLYMSAHGVARSHEDTLGWEVIPFDALLKRRNKQYGLGAAAANYLWGMPFGVRLTVDRGVWGEPYGYLKTVTNGEEEITHRHSWGWTTEQGCNHILASHANIDAWYQDSYSMANSWLINAVTGATIKGHKVALRYRHFSQDAEEYRYDSARDSYLRNGDWTERTSTHLLRGYGIFKILELGRTDLCLVGFAETERTWTNYVGEGDESRLDCSYDRKTDFEIVPVVSASLGSGFVRAGSDITWGWISSSNTDIWGRQRVYRQSYPRADWAPEWEEPGYSNSYYVANLSEVDVEYPVFKDPNVAVRLEVWRMYQVTYSTSHYGENESRGDRYVFKENAIRRDGRKETWMGGLLGVWAGFGLLFGGLFIDFPVTYHNVLSTEVIDGEEGEIFRDQQTSFHAVQDPPRMRVILGRKW